jgi:hypothetical protein
VTDQEGGDWHASDADWLGPFLGHPTQAGDFRINWRPVSAATVKQSRAREDGRASGRLSVPSEWP